MNQAIGLGDMAQDLFELFIRHLLNKGRLTSIIPDRTSANNQILYDYLMEKHPEGTSTMDMDQVAFLNRYIKKACRCPDHELDWVLSDFHRAAVDGHPIASEKAAQEAMRKAVESRCIEQHTVHTVWT